MGKKINRELKQGNNLKFIIFENNGKFKKIVRSDSFEKVQEKLNNINAKSE